MEAVENPNINKDAADAEDVSETGVAAVEGVEDQNLDIGGAGHEEAGVKVEKIKLVEEF